MKKSFAPRSVSDAGKADADDLTTTCGLGSWRPSWLQRFATPQAYIVVFAIAGFFGPMVSSYLNAVLSNIERRFGLQSKEVAWIYSGNEISQIALVFFLPLIGKVKKRPLWLGVSNCVAAVGILIIALPHFISKKYVPPGGSGSEFCQTEESGAEQCPDGEGGGSSKDFGSMGIIFLGIFITGFANSLFYAFGMPYIDDNSPRQNSPLRLSIALAARTCGPTLGMLLGAACLRVYVNPGEDPGFEEGHPSWVGAWWLGPLLLSALTVVVGPWLVLFPGKLKVADSDGEDVQDDDPEPDNIKEYFTGFLRVVKRLLSKKLYTLNLLSAVTLLFGIVGFFQFLPKYLEYQFYVKSSTSGGLGGISSIVTSVIGIIGSGFVMSRWKFTGRQVTGYMVCVSGILCGVFLGMFFVTCPPRKVHGLDNGNDGGGGGGSPFATCAGGCFCDNVESQPVCSMDGATIFKSPCHAGCSSSNKSVELDSKGRPKTIYWGCGCARDKALSLNTSAVPVKPWWVEEEEDSSGGRPLVQGGRSGYTLDNVVDGYCQSDCNAFIIFMATFGILGIAGSTTRLPGFIVSLRVVEKRDKAASITLTVAALSLFAFLPSPVIFGAIFDSACENWSEKCGETRNCLVYNAEKLRTSVVGFMFGFIVITLVLDVMTWYYAKGLRLYDDEDEGGESGKDKDSKDRDSGFQDIELNESKPDSYYKVN